MLKLLQGDCLELMKDIPDGSIDMILCDLPYGVLNKSNPLAQWDSVICAKFLWQEYRRIAKSSAAIVLFAQGMFTANLMNSNPSMWRYNLVWKKGNSSTGFLNANRQPLRNHEDILVFYDKQPTYNPQMVWDGVSHLVAGVGKKDRGGGEYTEERFGQRTDVGVVFLTQPNLKRATGTIRAPFLIFPTTAKGCTQHKSPSLCASGLSRRTRTKAKRCSITAWVQARPG